MRNDALNSAVIRTVQFFNESDCSPYAARRHQPPALPLNKYQLDATRLDVASEDSADATTDGAPERGGQCSVGGAASGSQRDGQKFHLCARRGPAREESGAAHVSEARDRAPSPEMPVPGWRQLARGARNGPCADLQVNTHRKLFHDPESSAKQKRRIMHATLFCFHRNVSIRRSGRICIVNRETGPTQGRACKGV